MKIFLLFILLVSVLGGGGYVYYTQAKLQTEQAKQGPSKLQLKQATLTRLKDITDQLGLSVTLLIPGSEGSSSTWNFRGSLKDKEVEKPYFGSVMNTCREYDDVSCWEVGSFVVDGISILAETESSTKVGDQVEGETRSAQNAETRQTKPAPSPGYPQTLNPVRKDVPKPMSAVTSTESRESKGKPADQWRTKVNGVNGRLGPGTEFKVVFKVGPWVPLQLITRESDWGRFKYPAADGSMGEVWISMTLVEKQ